MILNEDEILKVKGTVNWIPDKNEYYIPPFYLKEKELKFPKLPHPQGSPS